MPFLRRSCAQQPRGVRIELDGPVLADNYGAADVGELAVEHAIGFDGEGHSRGQPHMLGERGYLGPHAMAYGFMPCTSGAGLVQWRAHGTYQVAERMAGPGRGQASVVAIPGDPDRPF